MPFERMDPAAVRGRVLVVEDDPGLLEVYLDALLDAGFDAASARDVPGALQQLANDRFDVVLTDLRIPGGDGVDVLRVVREKEPDLPVVLVTGDPSVETAVEALELGALHYLLKPVPREKLLRCVADATRMRRLAAVRREAVLSMRPGGGALAGDRQGLEELFERALESQYMVYQPIMRVRDSSVFGWEALLRTSAAAVPGPLAFLELAERLGRLRELGRRIRRSVARAVAATRGVMFFVNLHAEDLLDEDLYDPSAPLSLVAPEVVLELTERSPMDAIGDIRERVRRLRRLGFRLAIDDLGAGYAGLTSFAAVEPEFVKLDRGLITGIDNAPIKQKLVGSIAGVSREMGITVVAEGVETAVERDAAAALGCDLMQGFLFRDVGQLKTDPEFELRSEELRG